jgi:hypothetical protein
MTAVAVSGSQASPGQASPSLAGRRSDAGVIRLTARDAAGLLLCGEMYGAPYDLLASALGVREDRLRGIVARWRHAGLAQTGRLGPGPAWCWLTRPGLAATGLRYALARPSLARLAHVRAVLAIRLAMEDSDAYRDGQAWWRSERRIRAAAGGRATAHVPDAEVHWPDSLPGSYAGECWAVEAELTPKPLARVGAIMSGLLARDADLAPGSHRGGRPRYDRVVYLVSPAARPVTERAAAAQPPGQASRLVLRDLPTGALL